MAEVLEAIQLDGVDAVGEHLLVAHRLDDGLLSVLLRRIGGERVRQAERLLEIRLVDLMGEDRRAFGDRRAQAARMIDVAVRVDDVRDRLVGDQLLRFRQHREAARLALAQLDHRDVILEVDRESAVAAGDEIHAVAELFGRRGARRCRGRRAGAAASLRRLNRDGRVRLHVGQREIEDRIAALFLHDVHRELRAADVLVVGVDRLERHVAVERVVDPRLDAIDEVAIADVAVDLRLVVSDEAHDLVFLSANRLRFDRRAAPRGRAQEAVRQQDDLELLHPRRVGADDDRLVHRLVADDRLLAAAVRRVLPLRAHALDARRRRLEVDRARVALVDELGPRRARVRRLAEREVVAGRRVLHRLERVDAHRA